MKTRLFLAIALAVMQSGCGLMPFGRTKAEPPKIARIEPRLAPTVVPGEMPAPEPRTQLERALTVNAADRPPSGYTAADTEPVYRNPKVGKTVLAPHIDKEGRLYGPTEMYQVVDEGGWNPEALEPGRKGYIPAVNVETPANIGSPVVTAAARATPLPTASKALVDTMDPANIVVTGLLKRTDEGQAQMMAREKGADVRATYDDELGWLLIGSARP